MSGAPGDAPAGPSSVAEGVQLAAALLDAAGVPKARFEARLLVAHTLGLDPATVFAQPHRTMTEAEQGRLAGIVRRRANREPMAHIVGMREFWSLPLAVSPSTLIPRPDSETVVEAALEHLPDQAHGRVLDLGTGSGCLLLAVLSERPLASGIGLDLSAEALAVAEANAVHLGLQDRAQFLRGDWAAPVRGRFDVVLCNPPYIRSADLATLEPEVSRFEPRAALDGGADGLDCYRALIPSLAGLLHREGIAALEIAYNQTEAVSACAAANGLQVLEIKADLSGHPRCVVVAAAHRSGEK